MDQKRLYTCIELNNITTELALFNRIFRKRKIIVCQQIRILTEEKYCVKNPRNYTCSLTRLKNINEKT